MNQQELEMISTVAGILAVILETVLFCGLWDILYGAARRYTRLAQGVLLLVNLGLELIPGLPASGRMLFLCPLIVGYAYVRERAQWEKAVFAAALFYGFRSMSWLIAVSAQELVSMCVYRMPVYNESDMALVYRCTACLIVLFFALYLLALFLMLLGFKRILRPLAQMGWHDVCFLSVLNVVGGLFANLVVRISVVKLDKEIFLLFDEKTEMLWLLPLLALLLYAGELAAVAIYQRYRSLLKERELYYAEQQQLRAMKRRLEEAEAFYGGIRRVRHEMKNHMTNLRALAESGEYAGLEQYLAKLDADVGELGSRYATGNAVTDVILSDKSRQAEAAGIRFEAQFSYPEADGIDVFDIGMVLNNLLDNAIDACEAVPEKERFVRLSFRRRKHFCLLEVENSYSGELIFADDGLPRTTKQNRNRTAGKTPRTDGSASVPALLAEHGVGLRNVREIAERYYGTLDIGTDNQVFKVTVLLEQKGEEGQ